MDLDIGRPKNTHGAVREHPKHAVPLRQLHCVDISQDPTTQCNLAECGGDTGEKAGTSGCRCCDARKKHERFSTPPIIERRDEYAIDGTGRQNTPHRRDHSIVALNIDIEPAVGKSLKRLLESGNSMSTAEIDTLQLGQVQFINPVSGTSCRPKKSIMAENRDLVGRRMNVGFDVGHTDTNRGSESGDRILRG